MSSHTVTEPRSLKKFERYLRKGFRLLCWSLALLYLYGVMYLVFLPDEGSPEDSRDAWCEEYHPKLTYSECADVAGW
jgi:hypothetical protein